jgi:hypothetical protein
MVDIPEGATIEQYSKDGKTGVIVRAANGNFLPGTKTHEPISHANARAMNSRRYQLQREAFAAGVVQAIQDTGLLPRAGDKDAAAWQVIANKATTVLLDTDNARNIADLMQPIGRNAGWLQQDKDRDDPASGVRLEVWGGAVDKLLDVLQQRDSADVIAAPVCPIIMGALAACTATV